MQDIINTLKEHIAHLKELEQTQETQDKITAIQCQIDELEIQSIDFDSIPAIPFESSLPRPEIIKQEVAKAQETIANNINSIVSKLQSRPTEELVGMARNYKKELETDNTGDFLQTLISDMQKAQEKKHEIVTAYADVFTQKTDVDTELRIATRRLYGAIADAIETGEIKLDKHRKNEKGEELASYELPAWLPKGIDVQNDTEVVIPDMDKLMQMVRMMQLWEVVSIDEKKLERYLQRQEKDKSGKVTSKFADPFQLPAIILNKFKPIVGKEADWTPED